MGSVPAQGLRARTRSTYSGSLSDLGSPRMLEALRSGECWSSIQMVCGTRRCDRRWRPRRARPHPNQSVVLDELRKLNHRLPVMSVRQRSRALGARRPGVFLCLAAIRLLVLLFSVELSGVAHAALDVFDSEGQHTDDCDDEGEGHECPPGCPSCHCWHAGAPTAQLPIQWGTQLLIPTRSEAGFVPTSGVPPQGADPESVYRPPRATTLS